MAQNGLGMDVMLIFSLILLLLCIVARHLQLLHGAEQFRHPGEVLHPPLPARAFAEAPEVRQNLGRDAAPLVGDADDDMLRCLADEDLDGRRRGALPLPLLNNGLNGVA
jgi:hypothetical protein